jgi:hypothetical protein
LVVCHGKKEAEEGGGGGEVLADLILYKFLEPVYALEAVEQEAQEATTRSEIGKRRLVEEDAEEPKEEEKAEEQGHKHDHADGREK